MADTRTDTAKPHVIDVDGHVVDDDDIMDEQAETASPSFSRDADTVIDQSSQRETSPLRLLPWILGASLLGAIGGGWLYRDVLAGYFPTNQLTTMQQKLDAITVDSEATREKLASLDAMTQSLGSDIDALETAAQKAKSDLAGLAAANTDVDYC
jgi:hypothetical protein